MFLPATKSQGLREPHVFVVVLLLVVVVVVVVCQF